jgi:2-oxoglutarate ferredoxin oxidoreductase subunit gamma
MGNVEKPFRYEIRLSGSGGQGIILAAIVLAEAVAVYEGREVCQSQAYGPEARGGISKSEVVISNRPIDYPKATRPHLLLAMNQASYDAYHTDIRPEGLIVVDELLVTQLSPGRVTAIPFTQIARKELGREMVANMVALGAVGYFSKVVSQKNMETALAARTPKGTGELNLKALRAGIKAAKKVELAGLPAAPVPEDEEV